MKLTEKQKQTKQALWAADELLRRYLTYRKAEADISAYRVDGETRFYNPNLHWSKEDQYELAIECLVTISRAWTSYGRKQAAKMILKALFGEKDVLELMEEIAVVEERKDPLVRRWRKKVISRDGACVECGSTKGLHAHHINHWSDDPVNRVNVQNGITLCAVCHSKEHPEISNLILSSQKAGVQNGETR